MASIKKQLDDNAEQAVKQDKPAESVYPIKELAKNHQAFGTSYAIVHTALKLAGKDEITFPEAEKIVNEFKNKEVR